MPTIQEILKYYWGYDTFRPLQTEIIQAVLDGRDTLALLPTGGGKSLCFQVPALAQEGICIVVSPLIALMQDQVAQLRKREIKAVAIYSGMHKSQVDIALDNCIYGDIKFLYISPERLQTKLFLERAKQMKINLLAIDEAHCVSQWGYDFRPPYLQIAAFRELIPNIPLIALTATATKEVKEDIQEKLVMQNTAVFQQSFARANLSYSAFEEENKEQRLLNILQKVAGTSVVYVRNRRRTQEVADWLTKKGISATFYHAGLSPKERTDRQESWIKNRIRVIVATNAFGMGIDKPDVRVVVHLDLPDTLEAYYQEAGRAGRDGQKSFAVLLYNQSDVQSIIFGIEQIYPSMDVLKSVYLALGNYYQLAIGSGQFKSFDFDLFEFQKRFDLPTNATFYALKILENEGLIQLSDSFHSPSKIMLAVDNRDLYDFQLKNPRYETLLKLLLRMYGGEMFSTYLTISESAIAKAFSAPVSEIEATLTLLEKLGILFYDKQKNKPQLTYLLPRQDARNMSLDWQKIEARKKQDIQKAKAVGHYAQHKIRCRTQLLLEYFGEITDAKCGVCDICLAEKKQANQDNAQQITLDFQREKVLQLLANGAMSLPLLLKIMSPNNKPDFQQLIRLMIEQEILFYDDEGNLGKR
jgi:ATP-dependent DNA helicase RecQ